jgi:hypothetical protein
MACLLSWRSLAPSVEEYVVEAQLPVTRLEGRQEWRGNRREIDELIRPRLLCQLNRVHSEHSKRRIVRKRVEENTGQFESRRGLEDCERVENFSKMIVIM